MYSVNVPGGIVVAANLFNDAWVSWIGDAALAIADPPYGGSIVNDSWNNATTDKALAENLTLIAANLSSQMLARSHFCLWGCIGMPKQRALFQAILWIEEHTRWRMAGFNTWAKRRLGMKTKWRCLLAREELVRFVLGDIKNPRVFNIPRTSNGGRITMIWDHGNDKIHNKYHRYHKPPALIQTQIAMCTDPGDLVLDLFAGSAEVSLQARTMDRPFVAFESDLAQVDRIIARLR